MHIYHLVINNHFAACQCIA